MPSLREEITKTFLRLTRRHTLVSGSAKQTPGGHPVLRPGAQLGAYRIVRQLGAGGMGQVYLALDTRLDRPVALKVLPPELTSEPAFLRRFQQEARTASALNHPNILTIYEFAEIDEEHIIVSEYVEGVTLRAALDRNLIDLRKGLDAVAQAASALIAAHAAGVVHRDLKPSNIMLRPDGYLKLIDFGLAKLTERSGRARRRATSQTQLGSVLGTVGYMSPEQARGEEIDERSDIWSLGVVLYEIVARHPPFEGDTEHHVIVSILDDPPRPIPEERELPSGLMAVITRALTKDRDKRYETVTALLADLQAVQREYGSAVASPVALPRSPRRIPYLPWAIAAAAALALGVWWWPLGGRWMVLGPAWFEIGQTERMTYDGNVLVASISPDGRYLAYSAGSSGNEVLKLRNLQTRAESSLPATADSYIGLTFSPDSKYLFYVLRDMKRELGTLLSVPVDALGSAPPAMLVRDVDGPVTFAPEGRSFAFLRRSNTGGIHRESILIAEERNASNLRPALTLQDTEISGSLAWSPDRLLALVTYPERLRQATRAALALYTPQGAMKGEFFPPEVRVLRSPVFLDGGSLLLLAGRAIGASGAMSHLVQFSMPLGKFRQIPSELGGYSSLSATADSRTLTAVRLEERSSVWVANADALDRSERITSDSESYDSLTWKDDDHIIVPWEQHGSVNLKEIDIHGGPARELSKPENCLETHPAARRGQRSVLYYSNCAHGGNEFDIWLLDTVSGKGRPLTGGPNLAVDPDLSPDGKWAVFSWASGGIRTLWRISTSGGLAMQISSRQSQYPFISPDGKAILCQAWEHQGSWTITILSAADGTILKRLPELPTSGLARWSPDGAAIDYLETKGGNSELWRQPLNGGAPRQLTHIGEGQITFFAWNDKGTRLAYTRHRAESDVTVFRRSARN